MTQTAQAVLFYYKPGNAWFARGIFLPVIPVSGGALVAQNNVVRFCEKGRHVDNPTNVPVDGTDGPLSVNGRVTTVHCGGGGYPSNFESVGSL